MARVELTRADAVPVRHRLDDYPGLQRLPHNPQPLLRQPVPAPDHPHPILDATPRATGRVPGGGVG
jgi:hypothetical protein